MPSEVLMRRHKNEHVKNKIELQDNYLVLQYSKKSNDIPSIDYCAIIISYTTKKNTSRKCIDNFIASA